MNIKIQKTDSSHPDFKKLEKLLDAELRIFDGEEADFFAQYNKSELIPLKYVLLAYQDEMPVGCGAIKEFDANTVEIKRMYVIEEKRGHSIAGKILKELENWAKELKYTHTILETGKRQVAAVRLYQKHAYHVIPNYGQYQGIDDSICMKKDLFAIPGTSD